MGAEPFGRTDLLKATLLIVTGVLAACFVALVGAAGPVKAAFPGENGKIAFARYVSDNGDGNYEIYAMNADGSAMERLTNNPAADNDPVFSPDGTKIAFESYTFESLGDEDSDINTMNADGTGQVNINNDAAYDANPDWQPLAVADTTPPVISKVVTGTLGNNGWYTSNVTIDWTVSDPESDISSQGGCDDVSVTADQAATTYTCEATSAGGTSSDSVTIKRDATAPTLNPSVSPNPVLLNGSATADAGAQDILSGIASQSCDPVDTTNVGANKSVSCSATDNAGNTNSASANYSVNYKFVGFSSPVDNGGFLNVVKAGQAIPLRWQLTDANNVPVTDLPGATVTASGLSCSLGTTTDRLEEVAAGSFRLQNLGDGYYQFNWKSPASYAKSCKTLNLDMGEGLKRTALFQFSK